MIPPVEYFVWRFKSTHPDYFDACLNALGAKGWKPAPPNWDDCFMLFWREREDTTT